MIKFNELEKDDDDGPPFSMQPPNKFLTIARNEERSRVEVHVKGQFDAPRNNVYEIGALYDLSDTYETVVVYINSEGGRIDMLNELVAVIRKFKVVVTVGSGVINSAAFMLWTIGDIRVVQDYSIFMAHRESYHMSGKTQQHVELANFNQRIFSKMVDKFFENVLTSDELEKIKHTEIFFSGEDLIERGCAIHWDDFVEGADRVPEEVLNVIRLDGRYWIHEGNTLSEIDINFGGPVYKDFEVWFRVPNALPIWEPEDDEEECEDENEGEEHDD